MRACGVFHCVCGAPVCWQRGIPPRPLPQGVPQGPVLLMTLDMVTCTCKDLGGGGVAGTGTGVGLGLMWGQKG